MQKWIVVAIAGVAVAALLLPTVISVPRSTTNVEVIQESEVITTPIGDIPTARVERTGSTGESDAIVGNKIISRTYAFEISAPDTENWVLINDENLLNKRYNADGHKVHVPAKIVSKNPNDEGYNIEVVVFVIEENELSIKENIGAAKNRLNKTSIHNMQEFITPENDYGILWYNRDRCFDVGTPNEHCVTRLEIDTFEKFGQILYNVGASVIPTDDQIPKEITDELEYILGSFTIG
jgi:hypothetical protein